MTSALRLAREALLADAEVMAEVDSVFVVKAPQRAVLPYIIIDLVAEEEWLRGLAGSAGQFEARVSVACHAATAAGADAIAEQVKQSLGDLLSAEVFDSESLSTRLGTIETWVSGASVFDWSDDGSVFRRIVDIAVRWRP